MVARNLDMLLGVTYQHMNQFKAIGISNTIQLLNAVDSAKTKRSLARSLSTTSRQVTRWLYSADLLRIRGLSTHYANLLIEVGICSTADLVYADIDVLISNMQAINKRKRFVKRMPARSQISQWQLDAQILPNTSIIH